DPRAPSRDLPKTSAPAADPPPMLPRTPPEGRREPVRSALPSSLQGTDPDGALEVDGRGGLVVDSDLRRFFDYFLSAGGEEAPAALRARIVLAIGERLQGAAASRAVELLDRYLAYRDAARRLGAAGDLTARLAELRQVRRRFFDSADAEKLFG